MSSMERLQEFVPSCVNRHNRSYRSPYRPHQSRTLAELNLVIEKIQIANVAKRRSFKGGYRVLVQLQPEPRDGVTNGHVNRKSMVYGICIHDMIYIRTKEFYIV